MNPIILFIISPMLKIIRRFIQPLTVNQQCTIRHKKQTTKDSRQQIFNQAAQQVAKDVFTEYRAKVEKDTVLKDFRRQIFNRQKVPEFLQNIDKLYDEQQNKIDKIFKQDIKNPEKVQRFSKKLIQKITNSQRIVNNKNIFKDQTDYSAYKSNYPELADKRLGNDEFLEQPKSIIRGYKFIDKLPDNYREKKEIKQQIASLTISKRDTITISNLGQIMQEGEDAIKLLNRKRQQDQMNKKDQIVTQMYPYQKMLYEDFNQMIDSNGKPSTPNSLSPEASTKIYQLYLAGWSIRDISRRFGILPQRTKFIIWCRAQLFTQVLPKLGFKQLIMDIKQDRDRAMQQGGYMDYGLDFDKMDSLYKLKQITTWTKETVDAQRRPDEYTEALAKLEKLKKFTKYEMFQIRTHGKKGKMYKLKEWNIFRGKGSSDYHLRNETFRALSKASKKMLYKYY